jgi:hypothetical protein
MAWGSKSIGWRTPTRVAWHGVEMVVEPHHPPLPPYVYVCRASGHIGIYSLISEFPELFVPLNDYSPPRHAFLHSLQANHW